jgi:hypothetical protein
MSVQHFSWFAGEDKTPCRWKTSNSDPPDRGNTRDNENTGMPLYRLIQYPRFQLYAVYRGPKKKLKIKEIKGSYLYKNSLFSQDVWYWRGPMTSVESPIPQCRRPGLIRGQCLWDLWEIILEEFVVPNQYHPTSAPYTLFPLLLTQCNLSN